MSSRLFVDHRWSGNFGIGRYSREIIPRLSIAIEDSGLTGSPASGRSILSVRALQYSKSDLLYSPGYSAPLSKARSFLTLHDLFHVKGAESNPLTRFFYSKHVLPQVRRSRVVFTVSDRSKVDLEEWIDDAAVNVVVAPNGVSDAFRRRSTGPDWNRPYILYVGNIKAHKNFDVVLPMMRRLADVDLVIVSNDVSVVEAVQISGLSPRVSIRSGVSDDELADLYAAASATIIPSFAEGFGMPALESLACSTPVIYWAGCHPVAETVGGSGVSVSDASDTREWARAVETVLAHRSSFAERIDHTRMPRWESSASIVSQSLLRMMNEA